MDSRQKDYFLNRRTHRAFTPQVPSRELIAEIVSAATHAPNTGNMQLYTVIETRRPENLQRMAPFHFNQPAAVAAPVILTVCADVRRFEQWCEAGKATPAMRNLQMMLAAVTDAAILSQQIVTIAEMHGLGTCYLGTVAYNAPEIAEMLRLPEGVLPVAALAIGYPAAEAPQSERLPLEGILHYEKYYHPDESWIRAVYSAKDDFAPNKKFVEENGKETLAQVFTDVRYPAKNNIPFSARLLEFMRRQGFDI